MLKFDNGGILIESLGELPNLQGARRLYADKETTSGDPTMTSLNPWFNCDVAGIAVTVDDNPNAYYIPVGHHYGNNLPIAQVADWWCDVVDSCQDWTNHNVKYDAHVSTNCLGVLPECILRDTTTFAKLLDSDMAYKGGYGLDNLSKRWLDEDISKYEEAFTPYLLRNKDYGAIPIDIMAPYACQDVLTNRRLDKYINDRMPTECNAVWNTETALTYVLFEMERNGLRVDPKQLAIKELLGYKRLMQLDAELARMTGRSFRPHVNEDCFDVLCNQYGLPIMGWTGDEEADEDSDERGNASFNKAALRAYMAYPYTPPGLIELIFEYRHLNTFVNIFVSKFRKMNVDGLLHCSYNQCVRTGRMSCKEPNMQQNSGDAKELIIPNDGHSFISADYSQIEFRLMMHYIKDDVAIKAFHENPDADFHQLVADWCGMKRRPAKTMNFAIGFGQGKRNTIKALAANPDIMDELKVKIDELIAEGRIEEKDRVRVYDILADRKGKAVYDKYHSTFPTMKSVATRAQNVAATRGFVYNLYGRRRHMPKDFARIAFNTLNQSSAADLIKERTVELHKRLKGTSITMHASVHDEILFQAPDEIANDDRTAKAIASVMESPSVPVRVPIRTSVGVSGRSWKDAGSDSVARPVFWSNTSDRWLDALNTE
jgi:DNA polymerase-1